MSRAEKFKLTLSDTDLDVLQDPAGSRGVFCVFLFLVSPGGRSPMFVSING